MELRTITQAYSNSRGYILVALTLGMVFLLGMAGLAIDVGRMYITKSEAQSFADSAAFSAALNWTVRQRE